MAVTGSSGLIGTALTAGLRARRDEVVPVVRRPAAPGEAFWDPSAGTIEAGALDGVDAVVHLAGAGIGDRRWTPARRQELVRSRVGATGVLVDAIGAMASPPRVLVSASAIGVYGDRGDEVLTEQSGTGSGFLAELCRDWEAAAMAAAGAGVRVAVARSGIVLSPRGGALGRQLPLLRLGIGGRLGLGRQWTSWVSLDDEIAALLHLLDDDSVSGPVNVTSPEPVTNAQYTATLARVLHRPAVLPVPRFALGIVLGRELTAEAVLASQRALPARLEAAGFRFAHPELRGALMAMLGD
ncbi:MAG: TIGR01777 family oxidoreductase [Acidimicrobiales bacterium]